MREAVKASGLGIVRVIVAPTRSEVRAPEEGSDLCVGNYRNVVRYFGLDPLRLSPQLRNSSNGQIRRYRVEDGLTTVRLDGRNRAPQLKRVARWKLWRAYRWQSEDAF